MRITSPSLLGMAFAAVAGTGYVASGDSDFVVEVHRPLPEVYSAFNGIKTFGSGLRSEGIDVPKVTIARPSGHEIVFTAPSANEGQLSRIAFKFESVPNSLVTKVTAAIDVPPITMGVDGKDKFLSEDKVEEQFQQAIGDMAKRLDQGNPTEAPRAKLAVLLDIVALASNPDQLKRLGDRIERRKAEVERVRHSLQRDGYEVRDGGEPGSLEWRHKEPDEYGRLAQWRGEADAEENQPPD